jgi:hypothetical protein
MIIKNDLQTIIEKYHLKGLIEQVKWSIDKNKRLYISFSSPNKEMIGNLEYNNFPFDLGDIVIFNTSQLLKFLSVTNGSLLLNTTKTHKIATKLKISDNKFTISYPLAEPGLIRSEPRYNGSEEYDVEIEITEEIISSLIKAKSALKESDVLLVRYDEGIEGETQIEFLFGGDTDHSSKISYVIAEVTMKNKLLKSFNYSAEMVSNIISSNKKIEYGKININQDGIMKFSFNDSNINVVYYLVPRDI